VLALLKGQDLGKENIWKFLVGADLPAACPIIKTITKACTTKDRRQETEREKGA
jgi:hypothetical protein